MTKNILIAASCVLAFGLASLHAQTVSVVPAGTTWKYLDDGSDQGTQWRDPSFDDSEWVSGRAQLGYGDGDEATIVSFGSDPENKFVTTYFRHSFNLFDISCVTNLIVRLLRDDGAVVYINGTEVFRNNMTPFGIDYRTFASSTSEGTTFFVTNAPPSVLVAGVNVVAVEVHQASPNSSDLSFDFELRAQFAQGPPVIAVQPRDHTTLSGNPAVITLGASGSCPLAYQWSKDGVEIPGATNASFIIAAATTNDAGQYQVVVGNLLATVTSDPAELTVIDPIDDTFQIVSLGTNNVRAIEHNTVTGDDRGGIAVSRSHVFVTGDGGTGLFAAGDLSGGRSLGRYYDALATDLRTERVYSLGTGTNIYPLSGPVTTLLEIDGSTGELNGNVVTLSSPIDLQGGAGIFSGFQRIVLYSGAGRVFSVALPSGTVSDLGAMFLGQRHGSESWAIWGVAEYFDGVVHLVYVRDFQTIVRTAVPSGLTEPVARFSSLSDMASFTISLSQSRWYFHHEGGSQFRSGDETVGYAGATFSFVPIPRPPIIGSSPVSQFVPLGSTHTLAVTVGGSPPFSYQWFLNDEPIANATNATLQLSPVTLADAGVYFVAVDNAVGSASSAPATITVGESSRTMFDDFEPGIDLSQWSQFSTNVLATNHPGGQVSGSHSLLFLGGDSRFATTRRLDTREGGLLSFYLRFADGSAFPWEAPEGFSGEGIALEYSTNEGSNWNWFAYIEVEPGGPWRHYLYNIPAASPATFFRWRQNSHSGNSDDHWALDDVRVNTQFGPPEIFLHPQSLDTGGGNQVYLQVFAAGSGPLTYQWHFNDTLIEGATNALLILENVSLQDSGVYSVIVSNALGTATSSNAVLRVLDPHIVYPPQSHSVIAGESVSFGVGVEGSFPLSFQWLFNGAPIAGATNGFLELLNVTGGHAGLYSVIVSNASGTATSSNAVLEVLDPYILADPIPRAAILGGTAIFSPTVAASEPVVFQWRHNDTPLPGATNSVLVISNVAATHAGEYSLVVSNAYGTATSSNALLRVVSIGGDEFQILDLFTNNSKVVEHASLTGDDRGGIAASATRVFYSGDNSTARFNIADLSGGVALNRIYDGLVSNLRTGTAYTLANGSTPISGPGVVDGLIELDGNTGLLTSRRISFNAPITLSFYSGIFAGYDRILLHNYEDGRLFHISLPNGAVTDLGSIGYVPATFCENWARWGVAEFFDHDLSLVYVFGNTIARTRFSGGPIETVASFNYLGDMCSFTVSLLYDRWYFHHQWQSQFGGISETIGYADAALRSPLPPNPVQILIPPVNQAVLEGGTAAFSVAVRGTRPITYQWFFSLPFTNSPGLALPGATNSTLVLSNVTAAMAGSYSVAVSNAISGVVSAAATLRVDPVTGATFQISGLFNTGARVVDHDSLTGDDRGGIAASASRIFISGDNATARFNIEDLSSGTNFGRLYNAMVSNLRTETVYTLANGGTPLSASGGVVNRLIEIDGVTGVLRPNQIVLSTSITLPNNNVGIFAGWDRIVLHTGSRAYQILLPSGQVNDLGAMAVLPHISCETWAYWGVAEFFAGSVYVVAVRDSQTITRTRVPDGLTTELARFSYLSDMCSITVSPYRNRWYFHHEGSSQFGGFSETLGFADATFVFAPILPRITSQPRDVIALDGGNASFRVAAVGGAGRLSYQWRFTDGELAGETNELLRLPVVAMSHAGNYSVVVSNSVGAVTSQVAQLTIRTLQGFSFRVTSLSASQCAAVEHNQLTGDDRGGIGTSSTHLFYSGDNSTARFFLDDLSGGTALNAVYDTLVSNLRTEQLYALSNGTNYQVQGGAVTRLVALDGMTALPTGATIELSQPIPMGFGAGIFAGFDRVVLYSGANVFNIDLPSGVVSDLGPFTFPNYAGCENWAFWGIAEYFDGGIHLVYVRDFQSIVRTRLSDGSTSTVATFSSLSDMCSITFSLSRNRWYFHHEGGSQFGSFGEAVGYCGATWDQPNTPPVVTVVAGQSILEDSALLDAPVTLFDAETTPEGLSVAIATSNADLLPLDHISLSGTGTNRLLRAIPVADAYGSAVINILLTDAHGVTTTGSVGLIVQPVNDAPAFFKGPDQTILEDAAQRIVANWATEIIAGPPNEAAQAVEFLVSNGNPALFEVQPAIAPNGTLSFKPALNAHGVAQVTVALRDNGGTQDGGQDASALQTFQIIVQPVNDPPVAQSQSVSVNEDGSVSIVLGAQDIDGDSLSYSFSTASYGTLSGTPPSLIYMPKANYFGADSFTFTVNDSQAQSGVATVSITVGSINDPPVAVIDATSPSMLATNSTNYMVIAPDNAAALVILEGWRSSDIENDPLQYFWLENETPFAHGVVTSNLFEVGTHVVVLTVSDGGDFGSTAIIVDVIAPSQAVESLLALIDDAEIARQNKRPMIATLKAAAASLDRGQFVSALNQLRAFQNKVRAQIAPANPVEAAQWIQAVEDILAAIE